LLLFFKE